MKLVSDNPEPKVSRERALNSVREPLRSLTANLIRVVRGAGSAYNVFEDIVRAKEALDEFEDLAGAGFTGLDLRECLEIEHFASSPWFERQDIDQAIEDMIKGALRITAAQLLDQRLQVSAGEKDFFSAQRYYERAVEEERKAIMAQLPTFGRTRSKSKATPRKTKTKGK